MIWYSHVNEDSTPERQALAAGGARTAVIVAGSGERVIALLDAPQLERVVVVDSNPAALWLARAKIDALRALSVGDYLALQGHRDATRNARRALWSRAGGAGTKASPDVGPGLLHLGALERWLGGLRPWLRWWLGGGFARWTRAGLSAPADTPFPARRFALLLRFFRLRLAYRCTGNRDPAFVGAGAEYRRIADWFQNGLRDGSLAANPLAHLIFAGHLRGMAPRFMPFSLREDALARVKLRLSSLRVEFVAADLAAPAADARLPWGRKAVFSSLSDLPSFLPPGACAAIVARALSAPGSSAVLRSFLRNRALPGAAARDLSAAERTGLYDVNEYVAR